jgi:hypothetical protein
MRILSLLGRDGAVVRSTAAATTITTTVAITAVVESEVAQKKK